MRRAITIVLLVGTTQFVNPSFAQGPRAVSPGTAGAPARSAASCPTFLWSAGAAPDGYQLAVYQVTEEGALSLVLQVDVPAGSQGWTPPAIQCPEPGGTYAWAVRGLGADAVGAWSEPLLFEVPGAPTADEVRQALDVLNRYREGATRGDGVGEGPVGAALGMLAPFRAPEATPFSDDPAAQDERRPGGETAAVDIAPTSAGVVAPNPATESRSLSVDSNIELGVSSNLFKDGKLLLWTDTVSATTAIGEGALASTNADSANDTAVGHKALANSTGHPSLKSRNTAIGAYALEKNTTGFRNTATGRMALRNNTTGHSNTADGELALYNNSSGVYNTGTGNKALSNNNLGNRNTAVGALALNQNSGGNNNTAVGFQALTHNNFHHNTALGYQALMSNGLGSYNTAVGSSALRDNYSSTADGNTAVGYRALLSNVEGHGNTGVGAYALENNTATKNTALGYRALDSNTVGQWNTAVGYNAGNDWTTGNYNIAIGANVEGQSGESNTLRIGEGIVQAYIDGIWGNVSGAGAPVHVNALNELGTLTSSARFKQDIRDLEGAATARLMDLRPVSFRYRAEFTNPPEGKSNPLEYGLIAEEVAELFPELVIDDQDGRPYTVRYHLLTPLLLAEIQRQEQELVHLRSEFADRNRQVADLRRRVEKLSRKKRFRD